MRIDLRRKILVDNITAIAEIRTPSSSGQSIKLILSAISQHGTDSGKLAEALQLTESSDPERIVKSIIKYLQKLNLINPKGSLSEMANDVIKSGILKMPERGKYKFTFFTDPLCGTVILVFERVEAVGYNPANDNIATNYIANPFPATSFRNIKTNQDFDFVKMFGGTERNEFPTLPSKGSKTIVDLVWHIDTTNTPQYTISVSGTQYSTRECEIQISTKPDAKEILVDLIETQADYLAWDGEIGAFAVDDITKVKSSDIYEFSMSLELKNIHNSSFGAFDDCIVKDVPIFPADERDAQHWIEMCMDDAVIGKQFNRSDFNNTKTRLHDEPMLKKYLGVVKSVSISDTIKRYRAKNDFERYWCLQSAEDLTMDDRLAGSPLIHLNKSSLSMLDLAKRIVGRFSPQTFVHFSRFLTYPSQKTKCVLFARSMQKLGATKVYVVSKEQLDLHDPSLTNIVLDKWTHDRHFAIYVNGEWQYYKMTGELDQCQYPENLKSPWGVETIGEWEELSIIKTDKDAFPKELIDFIRTTTGV